MTKVKICGIRREKDALLAAELGAWAIGFIFVRASPRAVSPERAKAIVKNLPKGVLAVGVFQNSDAETMRRIADQCSLGAYQLHGWESPGTCEALSDRPVFKAFVPALFDNPHPMAAYEVEAFLIEGRREEGLSPYQQKMRWSFAIEAKRYGPVILAGGLNPENVAAAVDAVQPYAVDVSSGVESSPGIKDARKMKAFFKAVESL